MGYKDSDSMTGNLVKTLFGIKIEAFHSNKNKKPVDSLHKKQKTPQKFCPFKTLCYLCIRKHQ